MAAAEAGSASVLAGEGITDQDLKSIIGCAASSLGPGFRLKQQQEESILHFTRGRDVFVSLPTGFGKSMCYTLLPSVFDILRGVEKKSIVLVVSPLIALMEDQVAGITSMGISAAYVSDKQSTDREVKRQIRKGIYQVIFMSPEALFATTEWRQMLSTEYYRLNLVAMVVDEAHCVKKWYVY